MHRLGKEAGSRTPRYPSSICGLGAILRTDGEPIPDAWLDALGARVAYRGPDGRGRFRDRVEWTEPGGTRTVEVALVHHRLTVIDPAGGDQPMVSPRGRTADEGLVAVIFNGCIYNHRELRAALAERGHAFRSDHSDTEVLIHGHREWGERLNEHLEGMYAYVLWDRAAATLSLARDWFGEKPLFYRFEADGGRTRLLVAASAAAAVAAIPPVGPAAEAGDLRAWVARYLRSGFHPGDHTYAAARGASPAPRYVRVDLVEPSAPFRDAGGAPADLEAEPRAPGQVEQLIERAVASRLEADVPLGCFLSGGVDSSLIASMARRHKPDLRTFCVRMPDPRYDESAHAARVARHLETNHTTLDAPADPAHDLVMLIRTLGQPFGDSSILPTYWVSKAAREHVKVALSGDGGDELFVGYERYRAADLLQRHWPLLSRIPRALQHRTHPRSLVHKLGRLGDMARDWPSLGVLATESVFTGEQIAELMGEPAPPGDDPGEPEPARALERLRWADVNGYLPGDLLCKVDTASMAVALEVRCPYLDRTLASALLAMPVEQLTPGRQRKGLLRRIARAHLPAGTVERRKMGFAVPIGQWFRADFGGLRGLLLDQLRSVEPFGPVQLERRVVRSMVDEHIAGRRDHGQRLFALLTLSIWAGS